jgi:arsenate reductase-like glutaredoxin family protein
MIYLRKFNEEHKFYSEMTEEELNDWLEQLYIERDDILERISSLRRELTDRKEKSEEEHSIKLPESVFDLNKEQFD